MRYTIDEQTQTSYVIGGGRHELRPYGTGRAQFMAPLPNDDGQSSRGHLHCALLSLDTCVTIDKGVSGVAYIKEHQHLYF